MPRRRRRPRDILIGIAVMGLVVVIAFALLWWKAGSWGVPYFSFTNAQGSTCTNQVLGYTCQPSLDHVEDIARMTFPAGTEVESGTFRQTHDYHLVTRLQVPKSQAKDSLKALTKNFGPCQNDLPTSVDTEGLKQVCVMGDRTHPDRAASPGDQVYTVTTALTADGSRLVDIDLRSL